MVLARLVTFNWCCPILWSAFAWLVLFVSAGPPATAGSAFIDRFAQPLEENGWRISKYAHPGQWMDTRWSKGRVFQETEPNRLRIGLRPDYRTGKRFASGEIRRRKTTHHGRYEAVIQTARGAGLNTAFFLYTGPHRKDPKDEIDFEFLGKDPSKVWINIYANGDPMPGLAVDLGFDASEQPHLYAFEWSEDEIRWYADGRLLHRYARVDGPLPITPAQVYLSLWAGHPRLKGWLGFAVPETEASAYFYCVSFVPDGGAGPQCSDP